MTMLAGEIARERATTPSTLIGMLDAERNGGNLSSTIRVFVLDHYLSNVASNQILPANEEGRNLPARASLPGQVCFWSAINCTYQEQIEPPLLFS